MNFVKINNDLFNEVEKGSGITKISCIGCEGFTLYTYLLSIRSLAGQTIITPKMIKEYFKEIRGFKDTTIIIKKIKLLHDLNIITITNLEQYRKIKLNDPLLISIDDLKKYQVIPVSLMDDKLVKIGVIGFTILCLLVKLHNNDNGYSNPSHLYIAEVLGLNKSAIIKYIKILEKEKLITVKVQDIFFKEDDYGIPLLNRLNNQYKVNYLINKKDKYYMPKEKSN